MSTVQVEERFDYIVVGGGTAGCIVAARLSEDPSVNVLLLEAGHKALTNMWMYIPVGYYKNVYNPDVTFQYVADADPGAGNRQIPWPKGRVLGGSSAINGLTHLRGKPDDYDNWAAMGNKGWSYQEVLPYFKKFEKFEKGENRFHGGHGPIGVRPMRNANPICDAFVEGGRQLGLPFIPDLNSDLHEGVGTYQLCIKDWRRSSSADHISQASNRQNLVVRLECYVNRILFDGRTAVGVEYVSKDNRLHKAGARREVILSGGAVSSPQILQLSGVGPAERLRELGIDVIHDLPGVGENLIDHYQVRSAYKCNLARTMNDVNASLIKQGVEGLKYIFGQAGVATVGAGQAGAFMRSDPDGPVDMEITFMNFTTDGPGRPPHPFSAFTIVGFQQQPESKGWVRIKSRDPRDHPSMTANYLSAEKDQKVIVAALKAGRAFAATPALSRYIIEEFKPGKDVQTDDEILSYARSQGGTVFHLSSSCRMGSDPMAVVDDRLRVHGIERLRVIDASAMPTSVSANICAAVMMVGEKGADLIKEDARG